MQPFHYEFFAGILSIGSGAPEWHEVAKRLSLLNEAAGVCIAPGPAFEGEGGWSVPFYAAQVSDMGPKDPRELIKSFLPYAVSAFRKVSPSVVPKEDLPVLMRLVEGVGGVSVTEISPKAANLASINAPEDVFAGLVGLDAPRELCMKIAKLVASRGRDALECMHMAFVGNPGTGKTELARRLVSYTDYLGVTDGTGKFVKVGEAEMIAKYVGHTAPKVKAAVESALGGMLFIDEAYAIANAPHFGQEAVDCLVDQLDVRRGEFVCVIAGYPRQIDDLFSMNPGLHDRFGFRVDFPDYSDGQLAEIFMRFAKGKDYELAPGTENAVVEACKSLRQAEGFSNARSVRRLVDRVALEACWARDDGFIVADDIRCAMGQADMGRKRVSVGF